MDLDWDLKERKLLPYLRSGFREGIAGREYAGLRCYVSLRFVMKGRENIEDFIGPFRRASLSYEAIMGVARLSIVCLHCIFNSAGHHFEGQRDSRFLAFALNYSVPSRRHDLRLSTV